jgi:hypothetical protein
MFLVFSVASHAMSKPHELITARLKDPESARFKDDKYFANDNACGLVNSKNSFGGYVGFLPWNVIAGQAVIDELSWKEGCRKAADHPAK